MNSALLAIGMPSGGEWLIVLAIVVLVFGVGKLPQVGKQLGQGIKNFKREMSNEEDDETAALEDQSGNEMPRDVTEEHRNRA